MAQDRKDEENPNTVMEEINKDGEVGAEGDSLADDIEDASSDEDEDDDSFGNRTTESESSATTTEVDIDNEVRSRAVLPVKKAFEIPSNSCWGAHKLVVGGGLDTPHIKNILEQFRTPSAFHANSEAYFNLPRRIGKRKAQDQEGEPPGKITQRVVSKSEHNMRRSSDHEDQHDEEVSDLLEVIKQEAKKMFMLMNDGFSVMLYGLGSKLKIIDIIKKDLEFSHLLVINGSYPRINGKELLSRINSVIRENQLCDTIFEDSGSESDDEKITTTKPTRGKGVEAVAEFMVNAYKEKSEKAEDIFLMLLNFDYLATKYPNITNALSILAQLKFIRIFATIENVNGYLGVDARMNEAFKFTWINSTTFEFYAKKELVMRDPKGTNDEKDHTSKASLESVLNSLTANAKKAFKILATLQLEKEQGGNKGPVEFNDIVAECKKKFIATNENGVRGHLNEFIDHEIIENTGTNAKPRMFIRVDREFLKGVIADIN